MSLEKRTTSMKVFIESQFNYCHLTWMLHSRTLNNKSNCIHERALRTVYFDHVSMNRKKLTNLIIWEMHGFSHQFLTVRENATKPMVWGKSGKMILILFP